MTRWCELALLAAERTGMDELADRAADGIRGSRVPMDSTRLITILAGLAGVVFVVWLLTKFSEQRRRPATYHSPRRLFLALAKAHRLSWMDVWLLWRLARFHQLEDPARLFLDPERFDREGLSRPLARHAARLQSLRSRLFAGLADLARP
jgi:hypothetical protein